MCRDMCLQVGRFAGGGVCSGVCLRRNLFADGSIYKKVCMQKCVPVETCAYRDMLTQRSLYLVDFSATVCACRVVYLQSGLPA